MFGLSSLIGLDRFFCLPAVADFSGVVGFASTGSSSDLVVSVGDESCSAVTTGCSDFVVGVGDGCSDFVVGVGDGSSDFVVGVGDGSSDFSTCCGILWE